MIILCYTHRDDGDKLMLSVLGHINIINVINICLCYQCYQYQYSVFRHQKYMFGSYSKGAVRKVFGGVLLYIG